MWLKKQNASDYMLEMFREKGMNPEQVFKAANLSEQEALGTLLGNDYSMYRTSKKELLKRLENGYYNDCQIKNVAGEVVVGMEIKNGIPARFRYLLKQKGEPDKGNTNYERIQFMTKREKLYFLRTYGFMEAFFEGHPDVIQFSRDYYTSKKKGIFKMRKRLFGALLVIGLLATSIVGCGASNTPVGAGAQATQSKTASQTINIDQIQFEVGQGVLDGKRCELMKITNNTPFRLCGFQLEYKAKAEVSKEQKDKFLNEIQTEFGLDADAIARLKDMTTLMHASTDKVLKPGESQEDARLYYYQGFYYMNNDDHFQLVEPDIASIKYENAGKIYTVFYDFASKKYTNGNKVEDANQWSEDYLGSKLPKPESDIIRVSVNSEKLYSFDICGATVEDYKNYVEECKAAGFTLDPTNFDQYYHADDKDGNDISVHYYEEKATISVMLGGAK